uniref:Immunoglobulin V-set domain-containing protein n=1 Tax=Dicentrarchus labrax TaxID=13489 RepID=A0A8P4JZ56_DICLA
MYFKAFLSISCFTVPLHCVTSAADVINAAGYTGRELKVCPYESKYRTNIKYICRGNQSSTCLQQALITSDHKPNRQFTLTDDTTSRKFTVVIKSLTQRDSGPYLCGVHGNTGLDVFSAVELEVKVKEKNTRNKSSVQVLSLEQSSVVLIFVHQEWFIVFVHFPQMQHPKPLLLSLSLHFWLYSNAAKCKVCFTQVYSIFNFNSIQFYLCKAKS